MALWWRFPVADDKILSPPLIEIGCIGSIVVVVVVAAAAVLATAALAVADRCVNLEAVFARPWNLNSESRYVTFRADDSRQHAPVEL
jgi:hypothetical protein